MFLKEKIQRVKDIKFTPYTVEPWKDDDWDGVVYIKTLSAMERDNWEAFNIETNQDEKGGIQRFIGYRSKFLIKVLYDKEGNRIFNDSPEDLEIITSKDSNTIITLFNKARDLNGYNERAVDDKAKN